MNIEEQQSKFAIHAACREGQTQKVASLLQTDPRLASRRDDDDRLPLHWATAYNHLPILELLSDAPKFDIDAQDGSGWTALMIAASIKENDALIDFLLNKSADVNEKTHTGQTALHFASSKANLDTARRLLAHKASARVKDQRGQLPLHRAAAVGSVPILKLLLEHRSPVNATDADGSTALHHAVAEGWGDAAAFLLKQDGILAGKKDRDDKKAVELAPDERVRAFVLQVAEEECVDLWAGEEG